MKTSLGSSVLETVTEEQSTKNCFPALLGQEDASIGSSSRIKIPEKTKVHKSILKFANHVSLDGSFQDF